LSALEVSILIIRACAREDLINTACNVSLRCGISSTNLPRPVRSLLSSWRSIDFPKYLIPIIPLLSGFYLYI
jgi:hypothetical protein